MIWILVWLMLSVAPVWALDYEPEAGPERSPNTVVVGWEYSPADELTLLDGGFRIYRGLGSECQQYFMSEVWDNTTGAWAVPTPVGEVPHTDRLAPDASIPDTFVGEVCYEATSFIKRYDLTGLTFVIEESYRSERVGFHRLPPFSWWGETVRVD